MNISGKDTWVDQDTYDEETSDMTRMEYANHCAALQGCDVVIAGNDELLIDMDTIENMRTYGGAIIYYEDLVKVRSALIIPSKTHEHAHVYIKLRQRASIVERILMQVLFGSDLKRESKSFQRLQKDQENPILFYEKPENVKIINAWNEEWS